MTTAIHAAAVATPDPMEAERERARLDVARVLADAYCRLYDAERALERAQRVFAAKLLTATAGDVQTARSVLAESLVASFGASIRATIAKRLTDTESKGRVGS